MKHDWIPSTLGHGDLMCRRCFVTNLEAVAIGMTECDPPPPKAANQNAPERQWSQDEIDSDMACADESPAQMQPMETMMIQQLEALAASYEAPMVAHAPKPEFLRAVADEIKRLRAERDEWKARCHLALEAIIEAAAPTDAIEQNGDR